MANGRRVLILALVGASVAGLIVIASCAGLLYLGYRSASDANGEISNAVDQLMRAAAEGRFPQTYQSATTPEFRQKVSAADYAKLGALINSELGAMRSKELVRINLRRVNADSLADVIYQAMFERGAATIKATMTRSAGRWLFVGLRLESPALIKEVSDQTCEKCGGKHARSARFCPHCGTEVPATAESAEEGMD